MTYLTWRMKPWDRLTNRNLSTNSCIRKSWGCVVGISNLLTLICLTTINIKNDHHLLLHSSTARRRFNSRSVYSLTISSQQAGTDWSWSGCWLLQSDWSCNGRYRGSQAPMTSAPGWHLTVISSDRRGGPDGKFATLSNWIVIVSSSSDW